MPFPPRHGRFSLDSPACLALAFALSACGGGGGDPVSAQPSEQEAAPESTGTETTGPDLSQEELAELLVEAPVPASRPDPDTSALPPEPGPSAPVSERAAWFLLADVSQKAAHVDPEASAECPQEMEGSAGQSHTCTLTYGGVEMQFPVHGEDDGGDTAFRIEYPLLPTVRQVVEETIRFDHGVEAVYCDMDDVVAVEPGDERAPYFCYAMDGGAAWVDSDPDTVSAYEVYVLVGGTLATYQYLETD